MGGGVFFVVVSVLLSKMRVIYQYVQTKYQIIIDILAKISYNEVIESGEKK